MKFWFRKKEKNKLVYGESKFIDDITLDDMAQYPIWVLEWDDDDPDCPYETKQKPVLSTNNVDKQLSDSCISFVSEDGKYVAMAIIDVEKMTLDQVRIWSEKYQNWEWIEEFTDVDPYSLGLKAVPKIKDVAGVVFRFDGNWQSGEISSDAKDKTKKVAVAKTLHGSDEYGFMYDENSPNLCPVCGNTLKQIPNINYKVKKKRGSLLTTYDGYEIVSEKFREFCLINKYPDLLFVPLMNSPGFYFFSSQRIYKIDAVRREVQFINKRECCGSYDEIIGASPAYKYPLFEMDTDDFICRTQYLFGTKDRKGPVFVVGLQTVVKMKEFGLKDLYFRDVYL